MQQYTDNVIQLCDLGRYNLAQCEKIYYKYQQDMIFQL